VAEDLVRPISIRYFRETEIYGVRGFLWLEASLRGSSQKRSPRYAEQRMSSADPWSPWTLEPIQRTEAQFKGEAPKGVA